VRRGESDLRKAPGSITHAPIMTIVSSLRRFAALTLVALLALLAPPAAANQMEFSSWLGGVRQDALAAGIKPVTLDHALAGLRPIPRILELDRKQPESVLSFAEYMARVVPPQRIEAARARLAENRALLDQIGAKYGVQPRFIVALWGVESDFGHNTGGFSVIAALATLAYDGRRAAFFRKELMAALKIIDHGDITAEAMTGSWAGAMGQSQFMPSSYLAYAVGWSGDGRRDIWNRREDVFASIANYLARVGWRGEQNWGREVRLPAGFDRSLASIEMMKPMAEWQRLGLRRLDGGDLPAREGPAALILPGGNDGPALLVGDNFRNILKWNNSQRFASAVGYLADSMEPR
jgi:membrane-bound lytic murein transglycosylase B